MRAVARRSSLVLPSPAEPAVQHGSAAAAGTSCSAAQHAASSADASGRSAGLAHEAPRWRRRLLSSSAQVSWSCMCCWARHCAACRGRPALLQQWSRGARNSQMLGACEGQRGRCRASAAQASAHPVPRRPTCLPLLPLPRSPRLAACAAFEAWHGGRPWPGQGSGHLARDHRGSATAWWVLRQCVHGTDEGADGGGGGGGGAEGGGGGAGRAGGGGGARRGWQGRRAGGRVRRAGVLTGTASPRPPARCLAVRQAVPGRPAKPRVYVHRWGGQHACGGACHRCWRTRDGAGLPACGACVPHRSPSGAGGARAERGWWVHTCV